MLLPAHELDLFFKLHASLMCFVNQRLRVVPDKVAAPEEFVDLPIEARLKVRDALNANLGVIESFAAENPAHLLDDELAIVRSWRHLVTGKFYVLPELKMCAVFLSATSPAIAYGVLALSQPFTDLIGPYRPMLTQAVLLPFKGMIVYDGLISSYNMSFGPGVRRTLNEDFKQARARHGIVTSLPMSNLSLHGNAAWTGTMHDGDAMWARKGATLSDKSARREFGLTQQEIIEAIRVGKLRFRESSMHGNPWYRLLRHEVEALVRQKSGEDHLEKKKLQKELADLNTESRKLTTRMKAIERRRAQLMKELDG